MGMPRSQEQDEKVACGSLFLHKGSPTSKGFGKYSPEQLKMPKDLLETNGTNAFTLFKQNETGKIKQTMSQKSAFCKQSPICYSST